MDLENIFYICHLASCTLMGDEVKQLGLEDFIRIVKPQEVYDNQVIVMETIGSNIKTPDSFPLRFEAFSIILVCKGEIRVTMDYIPYTLQQNMVLERGNIHLMNDLQMSHDFIGYHLILGKQIIRHLLEDIANLPKEYAISKRYNPVQKLDYDEFKILTVTIERLRENIRRKEHYFQEQIILNEVRNFFMELSNIGLRKVNSTELINISYTEDIVLRFMKLLVTKCKEWYEVSDYSTELCVTPVYLSRTIKSLSGKTALEWIQEARVGEAKISLRNPDYTVQDVSDLLHFSDQSAFGKFFKKHTGMSPLEYKKNMK